MSLEVTTIQCWKMYIDGAASSQRRIKPHSIILRKVGMGLVFLTLYHRVSRFLYYLIEHCINNKAEYKVLIDVLSYPLSLASKALTSIGILNW